MSTPEIVSWPEKPDHTERIRGISANGLAFPESQKLLVLMYYERARAEAAMSRLRVAVEALRLIESRETSDFDSEAIAMMGLASIGELKGET